MFLPSLSITLDLRDPDGAGYIVSSWDFPKMINYTFSRHTRYLYTNARINQITCVLDENVLMNSSLKINVKKYFLLLFLVPNLQ